MDAQKFIEYKKIFRIAPAGYGKTYSIVEALKFTQGRQLILTHTHAGVSSIKEKIKKEKIESSKYKVETISSFAQKYANSFYIGENKPSEDNPKIYHPFVVNFSIELFKDRLVSKVFTSTYSGLFVDEYQDCTEEQHSLIMTLSNLVPTRILGDPLQGIFEEINKSKIDFPLELLNNDFIEAPSLSIPNRWLHNGNNKDLGNKFIKIRDDLEKRQPIDLDYLQCDGVKILEIEKDASENERINIFREKINLLLSNQAFKSLLIIIPEGENGKGNIYARANFKSRIDHGNKLTLIEAIDHESFYSLAKSLDLMVFENRNIKFMKEEILVKLFNKTNVNEWFNLKGVKKKQGKDVVKGDILNSIITELLSDISLEKVLDVLILLNKKYKFKSKRPSLYYQVLNAIKTAIHTPSSVFDAMTEQRNTVRRMGRNIDGQCIGTTLLTKGLEFDNVVIINAHEFACSKHLYVALTRSCKRLFIFSENKILSPYKAPIVTAIKPTAEI
jgi:DNA helicase-2/ATP-dependent DNA helicase PcrA